MRLPACVSLVPAQLGRQVHSVLTGHMQRFVYSATGALRWKRDVTEYADWVRALRAPLLDDRFQELQVRLSGPECEAWTHFMQQTARECMTPYL